jgi:hypothetical protein
LGGYWGRGGWGGGVWGWRGEAEEGSVDGSMTGTQKSTDDLGAEIVVDVEAD